MPLVKHLLPGAFALAAWTACTHPHTINHRAAYGTATPSGQAQAIGAMPAPSAAPSGPSAAASLPFPSAVNNGSGSQSPVAAMAPTNSPSGITPASNSPPPSSPSPSPSMQGTSGNCMDANGRILAGYDQVIGMCVSRSRSYYTQGGSIYSSGQKILIKGINWFGLEGASSDPSGKKAVDLRLGGLWTGRTMESFIDQVAGLGFNAFRLPLSPEALLPSTPAFDGYTSIPAEIDRFLSYTQSKGMYVLLDLHNCGKNNFFTDKPGPAVAGSGCASYSEERWTADLVTLAKIALNHPNVVGIDLFNEPYGLSWATWQGMSSRAATAILSANPTILVFMEGVGQIGSATPDAVFWGENFTEAATTAPNLPLSRLVISPHVYGPAVSNQSYFSASSGFPGNMPPVWDEHFGYLEDQGYTVGFGEFGGTYKGQDKVWQDSFVSYFLQKGFSSFFYWCLNQNSADTGGIFVDEQWSVLDQNKLNLLKPLLARQP